MNIVLIGYRCSGKTGVGKMLARELKREFLDTDTLIEEDAGCSIETIVSSEGWDYFRDLEKRIVKEVARENNLVIATGGGIVMDRDNVNHLKRNGWIVWLKTGAQTVKERMEKEERSGIKRPSLTGNDPLEEIEQVLCVRTPIYQQTGNFKVDTSTSSIREVAASIMEALPKALKG